MIYRPNFLLVGAPRCGSSTIEAMLRAHPQAFTPAIKEPHYFCHELVGRGPGGLGAATVMNASEYLGLYNSENARLAKIRADCSVGYLAFHETTVPLIKETLGQPRILIILRNPVRRAFSSYLLHCKNGQEHLSFAQAVSSEVEEERQRLRYWFGFQHRRVSLYATSVRHFLREFEQVKVVIFEELFANSDSEVQQLLDFLGLPKREGGGLVLPHVNAALVPRSRSLAWILRKTGRTLPPLKRLCVRCNELQSFRPQIDPFVQGELETYFEEDISDLESLLGRSLDLWRQKSRKTCRM